MDHNLSTWDIWKVTAMVSALLLLVGFTVPFSCSRNCIPCYGLLKCCCDIIWQVCCWRPIKREHNSVIEEISLCYEVKNFTNWEYGALLSELDWTESRSLGWITWALTQPLMTSNFLLFYMLLIGCWVWCTGFLEKFRKFFPSILFDILLLMKF